MNILNVQYFFIFITASEHSEEWSSLIDLHFEIVLVFFLFQFLKDQVYNSWFGPAQFYQRESCLQTICI